MAAAWGPEPIWKSATIVENKPACPSGKSVSLVIEVDTDTASQYTIPGQYVQVRPLDDTTTKPLFLAMASAPKNNDENDDNENDATTLFEFIIKKTDGNEWITSLTKNKSNEDAVVVQVSQVLGKGFPVDENLNGFKYDFPTQNILLFATGSGIAPIKAAMEFPGFLKNNNGRKCRLYYGEQTADDLCCTTLFQSWEDAGYQVVPVLSQEEAATTTTPATSVSSASTSSRCEYVQNALEEDGVPIPRNSGALLCGHKTMAESVSEILRTAGVFEGRILTNF
jgi:NAD(P)H-flavin reductase